MQVYGFIAPSGYLPTIDPHTLVAIACAQLSQPNDFTVVRVHDALLSPDGRLPFLKHRDELVSATALLGHFDRLAPLETPAKRADASALHAFLDAKLLPLVLHSLYSLPHNYRHVRGILAQSMPAPARYYKPEQMRLKAKESVEAHADYWGLGGDAEQDQDVERRKKRVLLETTAEGWKERREIEQKEARERMRRAFGENKVVQAAQLVLADIEALLATSHSGFLLSSKEATTVDAHLAALIEIALLPLPQPLLADSINAGFPRVWKHAKAMREKLFSDLPPIQDPPRLGLSHLLSDLAPSAITSFFSGSGTRGQTTKGREKKKPLEERDFERKRNMFALVVSVGIVGWALGVGAIPLPGRPGIWASAFGNTDEEGAFEEAIDEDDDDEELDDD